MLSLLIPRFNVSNKMHQELVNAAAHAETVAAAVLIRDEMHFVRARHLIRAALRENGIAKRIDGLVTELLRARAIATQ